MDIVKTALVLTILDSIYLRTFGGKFGEMIKNIQGSEMKFRMSGAILAYFFLIIGLYLIIIRDKKPIWMAFILGLVIYGVYEGTNYAIIDNWKPWPVVLDTLWGGILFALSTWILYKYM